MNLPQPPMVGRCSVKSPKPISPVRFAYGLVMTKTTTAPAWSPADIPSLAGCTAVVTGANSGIGLRTAIELDRRGAVVTLACRDPRRGERALAQLVEETGSSTARLGHLDLASLSSVHAFASTWDGPLDLLVANAGIMAVPQGWTADGFERQLGTNHLGHFALTGLLLPALRQAEAGRVVVVSSNAHRIGRIDFDDLQGVSSYRRWARYGQSKLANLLFVHELDQRLRAGVDSVTVVAAHPGLANTNLSSGFTGPAGALRTVVRALEWRISQSAAAAALPSLRAATMPDVRGGEYYGPDGLGQGRGAPVLVSRSQAARDDAVAARLWQVSEDLTGVTYPNLPAADETRR